MNEAAKAPTIQPSRLELAIRKYVPELQVKAAVRDIGNYVRQEVESGVSDVAGLDARRKEQERNFEARVASAVQDRTRELNAQMRETQEQARQTAYDAAEDTRIAEAVRTVVAIFRGGEE